MDNERRIRCNPKGVCVGLQRLLGDAVPNAHVKGLVWFQLMTQEDSAPSRHGIVYRLSARDRGVMINYCPSCGADLRAVGHHVEEPPEPDPAALRRTITGRFSSDSSMVQFMRVALRDALEDDDDESFNVYVGSEAARDAVLAMAREEGLNASRLVFYMPRGTGKEMVRI